MKKIQIDRETLKEICTDIFMIQHKRNVEVYDLYAAVCMVKESIEATNKEIKMMVKVIPGEKDKSI